MHSVSGLDMWATVAGGIIAVVDSWELAQRLARLTHVHVRDED